MNLSYAAALELGIAMEMRGDPTVLHLGTLQPAGLLAEFGETRVKRTPISETAMAGIAIGAAASGWRPVANLRAVTFTFVAFDQIANHAAKLRYMTGGQMRLPLVYRAFYIGGLRSAAQHSQTGFALYAHVAGLKIVAPSTPADAMGLMRSAIRDNNPVVCFEANILDPMTGEVPEDPDFTVPLGVGLIRRPGSDATIVAIGTMVHAALEAAESLAADGISVEVIDPRSLVPFDFDLVRASVVRTGRLVVADESVGTCSFASEIAALTSEDEEAFAALRTPIRRVVARTVPIPYSPPLEDFVLPDAGRIAAAVRQAVG